ncbi:MAG: hypothetical protein IKZ82_12330 [Clostridia bacterium]|nr:hypothetical protein [Clostridia bacterium]
MKEKRMINIKKLAVSALAAALLLTLPLAAGCSGGKGIPLDKVLAVADFAAVNPVYHQDPLYDIFVGMSVDTEPDKAGTTRKCILGGREYELHYRCTRSHSIGGINYYEYAVDPNGVDVIDPYMDQSPIGFYPSGALAFIDNYCFEPKLELEIAGTANADTIRAAVEKLLGSAVDFDAFERFESAFEQFKSARERAEFATWGYYDMRWFNEENGEALPGAVTARVTQRGQLIKVEATEAREPITLPDGFDFEPYLEAIEKKARKLCRNNDEDTEIEITEYSATMINGAPYVFARVRVSFDSFTFPDENYANNAEFAVPIE